MRFLTIPYQKPSFPKFVKCARACGCGYKRELKSHQGALFVLP